MYLKSIEIVGFKSFAEKTRIDLKPGITGIIGPNGCGKSNIMESVRWSIGEMSWKSLRSESMVSIIFAGTARRNAMNLCEVTLTFDNAESRLPVQYSEVQVTRRIYRSGESEYFINKTQCRLRDIRELFLDTGIGNSGYAIIDQGGVDFVLNSKPEDRRSLFEEAAGVSKYKAKRQEALRKLDRVEIDLGRLQDSVTLINEQIKKLDADARKANLYQKYKTELVSMEAGQILKEVGEIDEASTAEATRVEPQALKLAQLRTGIEADEGRLAALDLERTDQEKKVIEANSKLSESKGEIGRLEERLEHAKQTVKDLEEQVVASRQEEAEEARRAEEITPEIERARKALEVSEAELEKIKSECAAFTEDFSRIETEMKDAEAKRKGISEKRVQTAESCQDTSRRLSAAESRIGQLDFQASRTEKELEKKRSRTSAVRGLCESEMSNLAAQRAAVEAAKTAVVSAEEAHAQARTGIDDLSERLMDHRGEIASQKAKIEALEIQGQRDSYWVGAHAVTNAGLPGILGTVRSLITVEDALRPQVDDLLGERLYSVVCADPASAKAGVDFLKNSGKGRARFLVASTLPETFSSVSALPPESRPLIDSVRFHPDHERVVRYLFGESYATENGLFGRHWICGGAPEGESLQLKLSDIGVLREQLGGMENERETFAQEKTQREETLPVLAENIRKTQTALQEQIGDLHRLEAQQKQREESLQADEEEVRVLEEESNRFQEEITSLRAEKEELTLRLAEVRTMESSLHAEESDAVKVFAGLKERVAVKRVEKEHIEKGLHSAEVQRDFLEAQSERVIADQVALERSIERRKEQQTQWQARIGELTRVDETSKNRLEEVHLELAVLEKERNAQFEALQKMQLESQRLGEALHARKGEVDGLQADLHASEMKISQFKSRREFLVGRLQDEWELSYDDAKEKYKDQPVDKERVEFLRRRIASLGNVNMAAPEEYEELSTKRDSLQGQIDDLLSAKQDIHSVIAKINATTRENFRQTFIEVREHFRKLYGTLFEGGEADVILTDKEDMLESGIDIVAQPPGKKLQSISQLSGGEKTLTAIALLFAFFMVKPSPMCMLDEADAALDDANVERFVSLIRDFGTKTQFLIVSHNKLTMEACDAIYGVTMEESGISQLISVDFKKRSEGATAGKKGTSSQLDEQAVTPAG